MCNKNLVRAAAASFLFGGTLGAQAAVVGLGGAQSHAFVGLYNAYNPGTGYNEWVVSASGSPVNGDVFALDAIYGQGVVSAFNHQGMGAFVNTTSALATPEFTVQQGFQTSEAVVMNWNADLMSGGFLRLAKFDDFTAGNGGNQIGSTIEWSAGSGPISLDATLGNEYYKIFFSAFGSGVISNTQVLSVGFSAVPAPGAAALVGLAGLMSRRRRA